ncbi:hypothetical protein [Nocardioides daeguensis]|uniref:Glycoside hydrolase family 65 protein n=1 Tax=Nocardioides daeguensis TaxID=908359 RepID=A0ABP6UQB9_9ACTN|nr:hypothetical protein [Nocardioides daeguensis]MBV6728348.1 hypothetical protein [Nocardioides daeguensis]MCR1773157.1 hypothetical protein [Nocardioides daeguensis]
MRADRTYGAVVLAWAGAVGAVAGSDDLLARVRSLSARGVHVGILGRGAARQLGTMPGPGQVWCVDDTLPVARPELFRRFHDLGVGPDLVLVLEGPDSPLEMLDDQLRRSGRLRVPDIDRDPRWVVQRQGQAANRRRVDEALFTLCSGYVGTRGAVEEQVPGREAMVLAAGVYAGDRPEDGLVVGPSWTDVSSLSPVEQDVRWLDLRSGVLVREQVAAGTRPFRSARFASLALPGSAAMRVEAPADQVRSVAGEGGEVWRWCEGAAGGGVGVMIRDCTSTDDDLHTHERLAAFVGEPSSVPRRADAEEHLGAAARQGFDRLLSAQRREWAERWATAGVSVPDDPELELGLRFLLFHLWSLSDGHGELAVGARGLSGSGYAGHVFWDADVFVLPAMMTIAPAAAAAMVRYRLSRLPAARAHAEAHGCHGARFPWESALTGDDVTPRHGQLGGEEVPIFTGLREEHVTADVAWAVVRQARWAGRDLSAQERRLLAATADYWVSRIPVGADRRAHLRGVIGPDEYHEDVDDNAFTNVMVRWNLRAAAAEVPRAGQARRRRWLDLADAIVDGYDEETGRYEQFQGYFALEPLTVGDLGPPPLAADVLIGRRRVARSQLIKQADVLMLHMMVPGEVAPGSLQANLDHYLPRTAHGSSLSPAVNALVLARGGHPDQARALLRTALRIDLDDLAATTAGGLHLGAMGGAWQAFLFGFVGVEVVDAVLCIDPHLPASWREVEVAFRCLSSDVRVRVGEGVVTVSSRCPIRARRGTAPVVEIPGGHRPRRLERSRG